MNKEEQCCDACYCNDHRGLKRDVPTEGCSCPCHKPAQESVVKETWEDEFDCQFLRSDGLMDKYVEKTNPESELGFDVFTTAEAIKSFIRTVEDKAREAGRNEAADYIWENSPHGDCPEDELRNLCEKARVFTALNEKEI